MHAVAHWPNRGDMLPPLRSPIGVQIKYIKKQCSPKCVAELHRQCKGHYAIVSYFTMLYSCIQNAFEEYRERNVIVTI